MKISKILMFIVLIGLFYITMDAFTVGWSRQYREVNDTYQFTALKIIDNQTQGLKETLKEAEAKGSTPENAFYTVTNSAIATVKLLINVPEIFSALLFDITHILPIGFLPNVIFENLLTLGLIITIFVLMAFFLKVKA